MKTAVAEINVQDVVSCNILWKLQGHCVIWCFYGGKIPTFRRTLLPYTILHRFLHIATTVTDYSCLEFGRHNVTVSHGRHISSC